jgi:DNA polymerase-3 subunit beta
MNITCDRQTLSEAAAHLSRVVSSKAVIPALSGILLDASGGTLTLSAYDMELGMKRVMDARISQEGRIVLDARLLCDIVRRLPEDKVNLSVDERKMCEITCGRSHFTLVGIGADDFPDLPVVGNDNSISLPSELLQSMVRQTIFAVADAGCTRPVHTGIKYEIEDGTIRLIATDGYRIAIRTEQIGFDGKFSFIVPAKAMNEVLKLISTDSDIKISLTDRHIVFEVDGFTLISRLLDGEFLDYRTAMQKSATSVRVDTRTVLSTIERVSQMIIDRMRTAVRCQISDGMFRASCVTELGNAQDEFPVELNGSPVEIGLNNRYLMDALRAAEADEIIIEFNGPTAPITIHPIQGESFCFLILPVRVKG